ncbi:MAG: hypothetical protein CMM49_01750 [Rhodospirillaceae bacterium]|nr:hypothetical protein [Rhodospirillaceae bacterium]|tara:strand:- start:3012 stop:3353 length:342 start_codon:yes stop_codon:yes gene_type:complete
MKYIIFIGLLFIFYQLPNQANAYVDGKTLLSGCKDDPGSTMRSICLGYVSAVADIMRSSSVGKRKACLDKKMKLTDLIKETVAFIEKSRLDRNKPAAELITVAFSNKYTCEKK